MLDNDFLVESRLGFNRGSVQLPLGVLEGQRLQNMFARNVLPVMLVEDFDQLPVPFRALATDLVTSRPVVIGQGSLAPLRITIAQHASLRLHSRRS